MPVRSAMTFASPTCSVNGAAPVGAWRSVCPCEPIAAMRSRATPLASMSAFAAAAKASPRRVSRRPKSSSAMRASDCDTRSTSCASASSIGSVRAATTCRRGAKRTSAASMPSTLVPEISPRK